MKDNTYFNITKLIDNIIEQPLYKPDRVALPEAYIYGNAFGNKKYKKLSILTRNFIYLVSNFEMNPELYDNDPLLAGLAFLRPSLNYKIGWKDFAMMQYPSKFMRAKEAMCKHIKYYLYAINDLGEEEDDLLKKVIDAQYYHLIKQSEYDSIIKYLSKLPEEDLDLYKVVDLIKPFIFKDFNFSCFHSKYDKELETALIIAILKITNQITDINVFRNEK